MAFHIHQDNVHDIFTCRSSFTPFVPPPAMVSLQDHIPDIVREERKKNNDIEYLPGEKLLIKLNKEKRKNKKKQGHNIDVDRIQESLNRVLKVF
jgi:hypothetical protein